MSFLPAFSPENFKSYLENVGCSSYSKLTLGHCNRKDEERREKDVHNERLQMNCDLGLKSVSFYDRLQVGQVKNFNFNKKNFTMMTNSFLGKYAE